MRIPRADELRIPRLGPPQISSPLADRGELLIDDDSRVLAVIEPRQLAPFVDEGLELPAFEQAGARARIFFDPRRLSCGIVTCGGICPGLNDVIRSIVLTLKHAYGVDRALGFRYGYDGMTAQGPEPLALTPEMVEPIHHRGGTLLGSSRGSQDVGEMVDELVRRDVSLLCVIGGDGTLRGAAQIREEIRRRELKIAVVGIPKTIDNDLMWTQRSFGFSTAVQEATAAIAAAHAEAQGAWNGIGLVKLMGRHSGFVAAHATLASPDVNFCLVPEVPFVLEGPHGLLAALERRLEQKRHAVIVVAEGAGQEILQDQTNRRSDRSGNLRLEDVGTFLRDRIAAHFAQRAIEASVKYIDPSYIIRSLPANALDSEFCLMLGQKAVHAGISGRTGMVVGYWNQRFTHMPISLAAESRRQLHPEGEVWRAVLQSTGQPSRMDGVATR